MCPLLARTAASSVIVSTLRYRGASMPPQYLSRSSTVPPASPTNSKPSFSSIRARVRGSGNCLGDWKNSIPLKLKMTDQFELGLDFRESCAPKDRVESNLHIARQKRLLRQHKRYRVFCCWRAQPICDSLSKPAFQGRLVALGTISRSAQKNAAACSRSLPRDLDEIFQPVCHVAGIAGGIRHMR